MCELFAMSSDRPAQLRYELSEFACHGGERFANRDGWGIAFAQSRDAYVFREPAAAYTSPLEKMVASHAPPSRLVMAHVRWASVGKRELCNTHPFSRVSRGQVHHFAHNGDLPELKERFRGTVAASECIGDTDSELAFLLLLERLAGLPISAPADRFAVFTEFCAEMRALGESNFLYAEGERLYAHAHRRCYEENGVLGPPRPPGLHLRELTRSGRDWSVRGAHLTGDGDHHTLIASVPLDNGPWLELPEGTTLLLERGVVQMRADAHFAEPP